MSGTPFNRIQLACIIISPILNFPLISLVNVEYLQLCISLIAREPTFVNKIT